MSATGNRPDGSRSEVLRELVIEAVARYEAEGPPGVEAICREHPAEAAAIRQRIGVLVRAGLMTPESGAATQDFPERIGDFRLLRKLGGGGMGVVYLAEQLSIHRQVALKLIRPDQLYFSDVKERFQREIDAVARLSHPSIANVFSVGEENGVPYFAMEYVCGASLERLLVGLAGRDPDSLSARDLAVELARAAPEVADSIDANAALFQGSWEAGCLRIAHEAALALAHAHARGVLHRDVKPANLMLTADGRVRLLDFGLAALSDDARITKSGAQLGSPAYMAPEQVNGEFAKIGARTDIYGLGVTLYELLTITQAYGGATGDVVLKRILLGEPRAPSTLFRGLSRDAETVCTTAMQREVARRYHNATDFAHDLQNVLERRPIRARRVGPFERTLRWAQRRPATAVAIVLAALIVIAGPLVYGIQESIARASIETKNHEIEHALTQAREAAARAERESNSRNRTLEFFFDLFNSQSPDEARGAIVTVKQVLDRGANEIERGLSDEPLVRAELVTAMGKLYAGLGFHARAVELYDRSHALFASSADADPKELFELEARLGAEQYELAHLDEADAWLEEARNGLVALTGAESDEVCQVDESIAQVRVQQSRFREAERMFSRIVRIYESRPIPDQERIARTCQALGSLYSTVNEWDAAESNLCRSLQILRALHGDDHPAAIAVISMLAFVYAMTDRGAEGEVCGVEAVELAERVLSEDHPTTLTAINNLAIVRRVNGDLLGAEDMLRDGLARWRKLYGDDHYQSIINEQNLGANLRRQKRFAECEEVLLDSFARSRRNAGEFDELTLYIEDQMSSLYEDWQRFDEAAKYARDLVLRTPSDDPNCARWESHARSMETNRDAVNELTRPSR